MKTPTLLCIFLIFACNCSDCDDDPIHPVGWKKMISNTQNGLIDVEFFNNNFGIICGRSGIILKTENGGQFWLPLHVGIEFSLGKVFILNEKEFYTSSNGLYKTSNGGGSFTELGVLGNYTGGIFDFHFFDSDNGLIYKNGQILKTADGGKNWNVIYDQAGYAITMKFVSDSIGYIAGGASWDGMSFGELHKTVNGGNSWVEMDIPLEIRDWEIMAIYFISEDIGYLANFNKEFYTTQDGGTTWNLVLDTLPDRLKDMVFLTQNEGYGIGYSSIYRTTDGGIAWIKEYEDSTMSFSSLAKTPNGKIFVVGNDGVILKRE